MYISGTWSKNYSLIELNWIELHCVHLVQQYFCNWIELCDSNVGGRKNTWSPRHRRGLTEDICMGQMVFTWSHMLEWDRGIFAGKKRPPHCEALTITCSTSTSDSYDTHQGSGCSLNTFSHEKGSVADQHYPIPRNFPRRSTQFLHRD